jgi:hypothetical protein
VGTSTKLNEYLKTGHKLVEGWLLPGAVKMVAAIGQVQIEQNITGNIAEIGVYHGKLFVLLYLLSRDTERVVAVDWFSANVDNSDLSQSQLLSNLKRHADDLRLVIHEGDSTEIGADDLVRLASRPFRLFSVDGGHTSKITAHDLATAEGALCDGGVMVLDDCFNEMWPGVSMGVHHYFRHPRGITPFAIGANKTFFCRPQYAPCYMQSLRDLPVKSAEREFLGARVLCCDFTPLPLTERIGRYRVWQRVKDFAPMRVARHVFKLVRAASVRVR